MTELTTDPAASAADLVDLIERAARRVLSHARAATRGPWAAEPAVAPSSVVAVVAPEVHGGRRVHVFVGAGAVPVDERLANPRYAALMHPRVGTALGEWLQDAARREREYRAKEPGWLEPDPGEEAWVAGVLAAALLREDPGVFGLTTPSLAGGTSAEAS